MPVDVDQDMPYTELAEKMLDGYAAHPPIPTLVRILCREINRLNQRLDERAPIAKPARRSSVDM